MKYTEVLHRTEQNYDSYNIKKKSLVSSNILLKPSHAWLEFNSSPE
jgi:hypothetical protein